MNKKTLIIVAVAVVVVLAVVLGVVLAGGNNTPTTTTTGGNNTPTTTTTGDENNNTPTEDYKLGLGVAFGGHTAAESNATVAVVVLDDEGKIVACRLDVAQNKYTVDIDGEKVTLTGLKSKMEQGDDYGMSAAVNWGMDWNGDGVVKEWYDQAKAFEAHVVGMTAAEVEAIGEAQVTGSDYIITTDKDLLAAGCTIQINDFKAAVVKACNDEQGTTFTTNKEFTLGVAVNSEDNGSAFTGEDDVAAKVALNVEFAGTVVADGKILATLNDAYQPVVSVDWDGNVVSANVGKTDDNWQDLGFMTKRELKEYYRMAAWGTSLVGNEKAIEWYIQSAAFSAHVVGMTANEVSAMPTQEASNGYVISSDETLLNAGCTMSIGGMQAAVVESIANAR